jgi:hypothetical protein
MKPPQAPRTLEELEPKEAAAGSWNRMAEAMPSFPVYCSLITDH